jgi:SET domain-containing protein
VFINALRDIDPNEDIFLDYGPEWTEAWRPHVESFKIKKPKDDASYISALDYI